MSRHSNTERLGVHHSALVFEGQYNWIFREQTVSDVGVDAIIEYKIEGVPEGKFLALQIKTGKSHLHITGSTLVYYISQIHYKYWVDKLEIPLMLVCYLPEQNLSYWQLVSVNTVEKTKKQHKITIPKRNVLDKSSKKRIEEFFFKKGASSSKYALAPSIEADSIHESIENLSHINEANVAVLNLVKLVEGVGAECNVLNDKIVLEIERGSAKKDPKVVALVKSFSKKLNAFSIRSEAELSLFVNSFDDAICGYTEVSRILYSITLDKSRLNESYSLFVKMNAAFESPIIELTNLANKLLALPNIYSYLKVEKRKSATVILSIVEELKAAKIMTTEIVNNYSEQLEK